MDFNAPVEEQAKTLLRKLADVGAWVIHGDPRAKPYLDAGAVRLVNGKIEYRETFISVYADELVKERLAPIERVIAAGKAAIAKETREN